MTLLELLVVLVVLGIMLSLVDASVRREMHDSRDTALRIEGALRDSAIVAQQTQVAVVAIDGTVLELTALPSGEVIRRRHAPATGSFSAETILSRTPTCCSRH